SRPQWPPSPARTACSLRRGIDLREVLRRALQRRDGKRAGCRDSTLRAEPRTMADMPTTMRRSLVAAVFAAAMLAPACAHADDQVALDACIGSWGAHAPFKKGTPAASTVAPGVKVFGIGSEAAKDEPTAKPSLVLVRPAVSVMGKSTVRLTN